MAEEDIYKAADHPAAHILKETSNIPDDVSKRHETETITVNRVQELLGRAEGYSITVRNRKDNKDLEHDSAEGYIGWRYSEEELISPLNIVADRRDEALFEWSDEEFDSQAYWTSVAPYTSKELEGDIPLILYNAAGFIEEDYRLNLEIIPVKNIDDEFI